MRDISTYTVILEDDLTPERLRPFKLIILPNVALMSAAACQAVREYVAAGGALVATMETSRFDETGAMLPVGRLWDLLGSEEQALETGDAEVSITLAGQDRTLRTGSGYCRTRFGGAPEVLGRTPAGEPLVVRRRHGQGTVLYAGYAPGALAAYFRLGPAETFVDPRAPADLDLIAAIAESCHPGPLPWRVRHAPEYVVVNAFRKLVGSNVFHLANTLGGRRQVGAKVAPTWMTYPSIAAANGGQDLVIDVEGPVAKATLYSPDQFEPVALPVSSAAGWAAITLKPDLLQRYSIVLTEP